MVYFILHVESQEIIICLDDLPPSLIEDAACNSGSIVMVKDIKNHFALTNLKFPSATLIHAVVPRNRSIVKKGLK